MIYLGTIIVSGKLKTGTTRHDMAARIVSALNDLPAFWQVSGRISADVTGWMHALAIGEPTSPGVFTREDLTQRCIVELYGPCGRQPAELDKLQHLREILVNAMRHLGYAVRVVDFDGRSENVDEVIVELQNKRFKLVPVA